MTNRQERRAEAKQQTKASFKNLDSTTNDFINDSLSWFKRRGIRVGDSLTMMITSALQLSMAVQGRDDTVSLFDQFRKMLDDPKLWGEQFRMVTEDGKPYVKPPTRELFIAHLDTFIEGYLEIGDVPLEVIAEGLQTKIADLVFSAAEANGMDVKAAEEVVASNFEQAAKVMRAGFYTAHKKVRDH